MVAAGWFTIYAAGFDPEQTIREITISGRTQSQLIWMGVSFAAGLAILLMDRRLLRVSAPLLYALTLLILVATIFIAPNIKRLPLMASDYGDGANTTGRICQSDNSDDASVVDLSLRV